MTTKPTTTKAEIVEALREVEHAVYATVDRHQRTVAAISVAKDRASGLPDPPEAAECRVAHEATGAMCEEACIGTTFNYEIVSAIYAAMERARTSAPAAIASTLPSREWMREKIASDADGECEAGGATPHGEPSDGELLDFLLKLNERYEKDDQYADGLHWRRETLLAAHRREREREGKP